jgi:PAS domain S-box-containing protein
MKTSLFLFFIALHLNSIPVQAQGFEQSTILVAERTDEEITVDGVADEAIWNKAKRLIAGVQDGGIGNIELFIQAAYDREKVYFFIRWPDESKDILKKAWVYDGKIRQWRRKLKDKNLPGKWIKPDEKVENEDRFALIWNIDNSIKGFNVIGCKVLCHGDRKHTNAPNERADTWHWKSVRTNPLGYIDDKWLSNEIAPGYEDMDVEVARRSDSYDKTAGLAGLGGNYAPNSQTMSVRGRKMKVPLYWEPNATGEDALFITQEEIVNGEAVKVTDPDKLDKSRIIPGLILFRPQGSRGDIDAKGVWGNGFWNLEISRKRKTGNPDDVQFDVTENYSFGAAVMDNSAGFRAFGRGHSFSIRAYTLQFGGVVSQVTNHLLIIKDYITMALGYVKKKNQALALSELSYAQGFLDEVEDKLAEADPERFLKFKRNLLNTRLHLNEKNLKNLNSNINEFIYLIQGKVAPAPLTLGAIVMMAWVNIQSYVFAILGLLAIWLLVSLIGILKKTAWKRMGIFLFVFVLPVLFEGIGRFGILTETPFLNYLSFTTNEYARLVFALTTTFAILYSRLGFKDLHQAEEELRKAHDELEVRVEKRTADLAKTNKKLQAEIIERKQAEEALTLEREKLMNVYENSPDALVVLDKDCQIEYANKIAEKLSGVSLKELKGKKCYEVIHSNVSICDGCMVEKVMETKAMKSRIKHEVTAKGVENWLWQIWYPLLNSDGKVENIVEIAKDITDQKKSEEKLRKSHEELRNLSTHLQTVREDERTNIAREIHDELGQSLTVLKIDLSNLSKKLPQNEKSLLEKIKKMSKCIDDSIKSIQIISENLRPRLLDDLGIIPAIEWYLKEFQAHTGIKCKVSFNNFNPDNFVLDNDRSIVIFRIFQETLTNVARHADATQISVNLKKRHSKLTLTIKDNGKGITTEQILSTCSFGIIGMRERCNFAGGKIKINGVANIGTTVKVTIPLTNERKKQ